MLFWFTPCKSCTEIKEFSQMCGKCRSDCLEVDCRRYRLRQHAVMAFIGACVICGLAGVGSALWCVIKHIGGHHG